MIFRVVIVAIGFVSRARQSSMSAPGWFKQRCPSLGKTEAAPNSYTGSGRDPFPDSDGIASQSLPLGGVFGRHRAPETSPCHVQAKQNGELDSRRIAGRGREHSPRNRDRGKLVIGNQQRIGSVRCRLGTWAASAGSARSKILGHRHGGQSKRRRSSRRHA
jgi:hypothetical protein